MAASTSVRVARPVVVVLEDEEVIRDLIAFNLRLAHVDVRVVDSIAAAVEEVEHQVPDVLVVDRMLPDGDGLELCSRMRAEPRFADVGLLLLTALGSEDDRVSGLAVGADDYVVKPFSVRELVARVNLLAALAVDRRTARASGRKGTLLRWRDLVVDLDAHRVHAGLRELALRPLEFKLLKMLLEARGAPISRGDLLHEVWGHDSPTRAKSVDVHVWRLRSRLGEYGALIETVQGFGYRLADE